MSKIIINHNIKSSIQNEFIKNKIGILNNNTIVYKCDDAIIKVKINNYKVFFEKENSNMKIFLEFEKGKFLVTKYIIKDLNLKIELKTETKNLIIKDNYVLVEYNLFMNEEFSDTFKYILEWRDLK